ncbi:MAG: transposase [Desulfobulbaceae bacterium]|nr:transposase [Desulfobulbaceae bacterium]
MPLLVAAQHMEVTDKRFWRLIFHYVKKSISRLDLSELTALGLDETSSRRRHKYITIFIDLDRGNKPVFFATSGKGMEIVPAFAEFLKEHGGNSENVFEVVSDMSGAFISVKPISRMPTTPWIGSMSFSSSLWRWMQCAEGRPSASRYPKLLGGGC